MFLITQHKHSIKKTSVMTEIAKQTNKEDEKSSCKRSLQMHVCMQINTCNTVREN